MHLPQDLDLALVMAARMIEFSHLAVIRQYLGLSVLFNPGHDELLQLGFALQMSVHSHLGKFREKVHCDTVGTKIRAVNRERHIRTGTFRFNGFNHTFRNIVPLDVTANVEQKNLVKHIQ